MKLFSLVQRVREQGLWNCLRWLVWSGNDRWQEWRLGIKTADMIHWRDLGLNQDSESYEAIDYHTFACVMKRLTITADDVFLDYGCGMGRVLALAARQSFRRVIGVELSARLCLIAEQNLRVVQNRLTCKNVQVINMDACEFSVPVDVSVVWLFSPFFGEVMQKVIAQIRESLSATPREITIIHVIPDNVPSLFRECDWLAPTAEFRVGVWKQLNCLIFQNVGECSHHKGIAVTKNA